MRWMLLATMLASPAWAYAAGPHAPGVSPAAAGAPQRTEQTSALPARSALRSASAAADTLRHRVTAGEVLIFALPDILEGRPVHRYAMRHTPALSWLVDRSFFWRTLPTDVGRHVLRFTVRYQDAGEGSVDVVVTVR